MFSNLDPHPQQVHLEGTTIVPVITSTKGYLVAEPPAGLPTNATSMGVAKITPGLSAPNTPKQGGKHCHRPTSLPPTIAAATGKGSFGGVVTPVNVCNLYQALSKHPKREFVTKLCTELREGARIGYSGPRCFRFSNNLPTAALNPEVVTRNLLEEVGKGRTVGPFSSPPFENFQVSPIGLVPKKHSDKFRTIFHLSFPKSGTSSINHFIEKDDFSLQYITIDNAIAAIQEFGPHCFMAKTDIESAFRLFPVHPEDWELLGMFWDGQYYFDKVLPFGLRSAPFIFNQLSDALEWILLNKCAISFVCHILDDFLIVEPPSSTPPLDSLCQASLSSMIMTFKNLNIPISSPKTEGPCYSLQFMGIILDSHRMEARLPEDKVERIKTALSTFQSQRSTTLRELQSLIGTLNFACKVIPPGRPFLQRIIQLTRGVKQPHHHIKLTAGFHKDIDMWKIFIEQWNGVGLFLSSQWDTSDTLSLFTDASGSLGYGGIFQNSWFQGRWSPSQLLGQPGISILWQELFAINIACHLWGPHWTSKRIKFYCDNQGVVEVINSRRSKVPRVMDLVQDLTLCTLKHNFYFRAVHVPGKNNNIADSLSRFQMERFRRLAPQANKTPDPIPVRLYNL